MAKLLISSLLAVGLLFGGGGATALAAQSSMPEDALYPVKIFTEDARLSMTSNPAEILDYSLLLADRRDEELLHLLQSGAAMPASLFERLIGHLELALQTASEMDDSAEPLARVRQRLENQLALLQMAGAGPAYGAGGALLAMERVQQRLELTQGNLGDPAVRAQIRERLQQDSGFGPGPRTSETPPGAQNGNGQGNSQSGETPAPGKEDGEPGNPWTEGTPTPGSGYGPGPDSGEQGNGQGGNPWAEGTPTPGSGYGPGSCGESTCTKTPPGRGAGQS